MDGDLRFKARCCYRRENKDDLKVAMRSRATAPPSGSGEWRVWEKTVASTWEHCQGSSVLGNQVSVWANKEDLKRRGRLRRGFCWCLVMSSTRLHERVSEDEERWEMSSAEETPRVAWGLESGDPKWWHREPEFLHSPNCSRGDRAGC